MDMKRKELNKKNRLYTPSSETTVYINYTPVARVLEVQFTGGERYHYLKVEPEVWADYKETVESGGSSGTFVNKRIKPFYDDRKLSS
jgi:hypothetical protein